MQSNKLKLPFFAVALFLCFGSVASSVSAAFPYNFEPKLTLTGDCVLVPPDTELDPSCPYPPFPDGPSGVFEEVTSVAIDAYGNEYVASNKGKAGARVDVFSDNGTFLTELPIPKEALSVGVDRKGQLYVFEGFEITRYSPNSYLPEKEEIAYSTSGTSVAKTLFGRLAVDLSTDKVFVANGGEIQEFGSAIEGNPLLNTFSNAKLGAWNTWIAVDAQRRRLYSSYCKNLINNCGVLVFEADAPYGLLEEIDGSSTPAKKFFSTKGWLSIAVDEESGHFFVDDLEATDRVYEFDEDYALASVLEFGPFSGGNALQIAVSNSPLESAAANRHVLFVPSVVGAGRAFAFAPPEITEPQILGTSAANIGETEAELRATVDPNGGATDWVIEYVGQKEFEETGYANAQVVGEGRISAANIPEQVTALINGLQSGTGYRMRVSVKNEAGDDEAGSGFSTYSDPPIQLGSCANVVTRVGSSLALPDCRAYELVTPADTGGKPPRGAGYVGDQFAMVGASSDGGSVSFTLRGGVLSGSEGNGGFNGDQYRTTRGPDGWTTVGIGPSGFAAIAAQPGSTSPDQGYSFWTAAQGGDLVLEGNPTHYVRYPDGRLELTGRGSVGTDPTAQGMMITGGGSHIVVASDAQLEPNAPPKSTPALYDRTPNGVTHLISLLPGDVAPAAGEKAVYQGASADGEGIAFEVAGTLYVRVGNETTYEVGKNVDLAGVSEGGRRVFYVEGGDLLAFDTETEEVIEFSETGDATVVNVATDGDRAYFASPSVLGGENPNGAVAQAGKQNLYLSEEGQVSFVGTVTDRDVEGEVTPFGTLDGLGLLTDVQGKQAAWNPSRLTPNGSVMLFQSRAKLDGYDPEGAAQIYRYDSAANRLHCVSCIPTKVPASGGASIQSYGTSSFGPQPFSGFGVVPAITPDGNRAFFESTEALVSGDTDGVQDVYEWEEDGVGSCKREGGCIYLITSGHSAKDNFLFGHSENGNDVFFTTGDQLTKSDGSGAPSIYDARVNGGFAEAGEEVCAGEGCRPRMTPAPAVIAPARPTESADDNVPRTCPKGQKKVKRNGKFVCVKKKPNKQKNKGKAGQNGRAGK